MYDLMYSIFTWILLLTNNRHSTFDKRTTTTYIALRIRGEETNTPTLSSKHLPPFCSGGSYDVYRHLTGTESKNKRVRVYCVKQLISGCMHSCAQVSIMLNPLDYTSQVNYVTLYLDMSIIINFIFLRIVKPCLKK